MIFIALQNPGVKYSKTRHNAGAIFLKSLEDEFHKKGFIYWKGQSFSKVKFYFSDVFMNESGLYVKEVLKKEKVKPEDIYICFDDINLPLGKILISIGQGASSHNGIKSIQESIQNNQFNRVRIGVGEISDDKNLKVKKVAGEFMSDFVLSNIGDLGIAIIKSLINKI